jgi:DNA-binding PadR family transcriptional regulator
MNRRKGALISLEIEVLLAALLLRERGIHEFHGFLIGKTLEADGSRSLIGHGTLYKALSRLEERQCLKSRWEGGEASHRDRGPRRRLYKITAEGQQALAAALGAGGRATPKLRPAFS